MYFYVFFQVIEVKVKRRIGKFNFVICMRQIFENYYGDKLVGMGGIFVIQKGKVKFYIMVRVCVCVYVFKILGFFDIY